MYCVYMHGLPNSFLVSAVIELYILYTSHASQWTIQGTNISSHTVILTLESAG